MRRNRNPGNINRTHSHPEISLIYFATMSKVLVTGASGFVAAHTVLQLLDKGYSVVGTVRSKEKGESLARQIKNDNFSFEIVPKIEEEGSLDGFVANHSDAKVLIHIALPFRFDVSDIAQDLLIPAVEGTKNALVAAQKHGDNIETVVVTLSHAAVANILEVQNCDVVETEDSWSPLTWETSLLSPMHGYCGSKKLAEKYAWDFVEKEKPKFALVSVNPVYIFGPQPFDELAKKNLNTSNEIIDGLLKLKATDSDWPHTVGNAVDVRDVAKAHIVAFENGKASGKRLLVSAGPFTDQTLLDIIHKNFRSLGDSLPVGTPGSDLEDFKKKPSLDNARTREILKFPLRSIEESVCDTVSQILEVRK